MRKVLSLLALVTLPLVLSACTGKSGSNVNVVTIDLTNPNQNLNASVTPVTNVNGSTNTNSATNVNASTNLNTNTAKTVTVKAVSVTASGFSPAAITVSPGATVTWTNNTAGDVRVASDPHPTLTDLPGLDSKTLAKGGTYTYTFTQAGTWGYHNFLEPTQKGTVTVK